MRRPATHERRLWLGKLAAALVLTMVGGVASSALAQAPGPESFAKKPETPKELWDAADYLVRTGQADQAIPFLNAFIKSNPSDDDLLEIRDRYGAGSVLRLEDHPQTRPLAAPLLAKFSQASLRKSRNPERMRRFVKALTGTGAEQQYAVEQLRQAGPYAVPIMIEALHKAELTGAEKALIVANMGRLDRSVIPALAAMLDAPDASLAADAAEALGSIGDPHAVPFLVALAANPTETTVRPYARRSIERLTGTPFAALRPAPIRLLIDEARRYLTHKVEFPTDPVEIWTWNGDNVVPRAVSKGEAEGYLGLELARQALELDPADHQAQVTLVSLMLQKAIERVGLEWFPAKDPSGALPQALAAGPRVLGDVLRLALNEGLGDLSAAAASILGRVTDRDVLISDAPAHPLLEALSAPDRHTRFAAARALVNLDPMRPFAGSDRLVPVLAQFLGTRSLPRVVVIDGDVNRANLVASVLKELGFDPTTAATGPQGFRDAARSAGVEAIFLQPTALQGPWLARDILANLRADASTAGVPIFLYGSQTQEDRLGNALRGVPRSVFVITPTDASAFRPVLDRELVRMGARPLSDSERKAYAEQAAVLLATIASRPGSPLASTISAYEPVLTGALADPPTTRAASFALADVPDRNAQRSLADVVLDPARSPEQRRDSANDLARSLQRFGPLVTGVQEQKLSAELDAATDPVLKTALAEVVGALRPKSTAVGPRLRAVEPGSALPPPTRR